MNIHNDVMRQLAKLGLLLMMGGSMSAFSESWKEEVLLHDGSKIVVERSQNRGGRHEIGQGSPISEYNISFVLPNTSKTIKWKNEFSEDVGRADLHPLALHILNGATYLITEPVGCLAYNKWGRPNPPYVIFTYDGKDWQRILIQELPVEFKEINLVNNTKEHAEKMSVMSIAAADVIKKFNSSLRQPEYQAVLRDPIKPHTVESNVNCEELVFYKGAWVGPGDSIGKRMMDRKFK